MGKRTRKPNRSVITYPELLRNIGKRDYLRARKFTRREIKLIIDSFLDEMLGNVLEFEEIRIRGFGYFYRYTRSKRITYHPQTKEQIIIAPHLDVKFIPGRFMKRRLGLVEEKKTKTGPKVIPVKKEYPVDF